MYVRVSYYDFSIGKAILKKVRSLPCLRFTIPQKTRVDAQIPFVHQNKSTETLGVWGNLADTSKEYVEKMKKGGLKWVSKLNTNK